MLNEDDMLRIRAKLQRAHEEIQDVFDGWSDAMDTDMITALYNARTAIEVVRERLRAREAP